MSCVDTDTNSYKCSVWANPTIARPCEAENNPGVAAMTGLNCGDDDIGNPKCQTCTTSDGAAATQRNIARGSRYYYNACNPDTNPSLYPDYSTAKNAVYDGCAATCATYGYNVNDDRASKCAGLTIYKGTITPTLQDFNVFGAQINSWINQENQENGSIKVFFVPEAAGSLSGRLRINTNGVKFHYTVAGWWDYYSRGDGADIMITTNDQGTGTYTTTITLLKIDYHINLTATIAQIGDSDSYSLNLTDDTPLRHNYNVTLSPDSTVPDPTIPPPPLPENCAEYCQHTGDSYGWDNLCTKWRGEVGIAGDRAFRCRGCTECTSRPQWSVDSECTVGNFVAGYNAHCREFSHCGEGSICTGAFRNTWWDDKCYNGEVIFGDEDEPTQQYRINDFQNRVYLGVGCGLPPYTEESCAEVGRLKNLFRCQR